MLRFKKHNSFLAFLAILTILLFVSCGSDDSPTKPDEEDDSMVLIKAGKEFMMGSTNGGSDEKPVHKVYLDDFYMDKYEVTSTQYCQFLNEKGNQSEGGATWLNITDFNCRIRKQDGKYVPETGYENHPVGLITWYGAAAYAEWAGKRLPTEAEWEYAARGGLERQEYPWGDSINNTMANYNNNVGDSTPVGKYPANGYGLYDMGGNVYEWCADWYDAGYYTNSPYENPVGPERGDYRVMRGGCWISASGNLRCADRSGEIPKNSHLVIGFRCAR